MKTVCVALVLLLAGCATSPPPTFCYQLSAQEQMPGKNCIPSGGNGGQ